MENSKGQFAQDNSNEANIENVRRHILEDSMPDTVFVMQVRDYRKDPTVVNVSEKSREICAKIITDLEVYHDGE